MEEVIGSIPIRSTKQSQNLAMTRRCRDVVCGGLQANGGLQASKSAPGPYDECVIFDGEHRMAA
jgi:hypothetical protein